MIIDFVNFPAHSKVPKIPVIYGIKNKINNKIYIGATTNFQDRSYRHILHLSQNIHHNKSLQNDYNKFSYINFQFIIICSLINLKYIDFWEQYFYNYYKSYETDKGYNAWKTIDGTGEKTSQESILKMIKSRTGLKRSEETKKRMSEARKGKVVSQETKDKITKSNTGRKYSFSEKRGKKLLGKKRSREACFKSRLANKIDPFICVQTKDIFDSTGNAARKLHLKTHAILRCLKNPNRSTKGFSFRFLNDDEKEKLIKNELSINCESLEDGLPLE